MTEFLKNNWTYLAALATAASFSYIQLRIIWLARRKQKKAYNIFFSNVLKLFVSYVSYRESFTLRNELSIPEESYLIRSDIDDSFSKDIEEFEATVKKEADIIPEALLLTHSLLDVLKQFTFLEKVKNLSSEKSPKLSSEELLASRRAQIHTYGDLLNEIFVGLLERIQKKSDVKKDLLKEIIDMNSSEFAKIFEDFIGESSYKMMQSLNMQGALPDEYKHMFDEQFEADPNSFD